MRQTGYLSAQENQKFVKKAKELGITEYALATLAFHEVIILPRERVKEHLIASKLKEFFESGREIP